MESLTAEQHPELCTSIPHFAEFIERGTDTINMEVNASTTSSRSSLALEERAKAIQPGESRVCELCGDNISNERLEVLPHTTLCVRCQSACDGTNHNHH